MSMKEAMHAFTHARAVLVKSWRRAARGERLPSGRLDRERPLLLT